MSTVSLKKLLNDRVLDRQSKDGTPAAHFSLQKNFSPLVLALLNIFLLSRLQIIDIKLQDSTIRTVTGPSLSQDQCERILDKLMDLSHDPTGHLLCSLGHRLSHVPLFQYFPVGSPLSNQVKAKCSLQKRKKVKRKKKI